jgi:hypothetical protein
LSSCIGQAALAELEQLDTLLVGIKNVAHIVTRYNIYEALYRSALQGEEALIA